MKFKSVYLVLLFCIIPVSVFSQTLHWNKILIPSTLDFRAVSFINQNTGYILGKVSGTDTIYKTTNSGLNWERIAIPYEMNTLMFYNSNLGFGAGNLGNVYKTVNGGLNWQQINLGNVYAYNTLYILDSNTIFVAGTSIFYTTNGGANWTLGSSGAAFGQVLSFDFKDSLNGIACGRRDSLGLKAATIFRTSNGGANWTREYFTSYTEFKKVKYINNNIVYVYGASNPSTTDIFGKSTDNGNTWSFTNQTPGSLYESIEIYDESYAWKFRRTGQIFKSTNGCLSWFREDSTSVTLWSSCFTSSTNGWVVGYPGAIFHYDYLTGISSETGVSEEFILEQNYPNPFNSQTQIKWNMEKAGNVSVTLYDLSGKEIKTMVNGTYEAGRHSILFSSESLPSGVYYYRLKSENYQITKKLIILK